MLTGIDMRSTDKGHIIGDRFDVSYCQSKNFYDRVSKISSFLSSDNIPLSTFTLEELLPHTLMANPAVTAQKNDKMWTITAMLCTYLESFTDNIIVMDGKKPLGLLGGRETLSGILKNPTLEFFDEFTAGDVMHEHINVISRKTTFSEVIDMMARQRIGTALIPYGDKGFASISVRTFLEIAAMSNSKKRVDAIPKKTIVTINNESTIGDVLITMFQKQTRRLIFDDFSSFISDRSILETIAVKLNYCSGTPNFLAIKARLFKTTPLAKIYKNITIPELAKIMLGMNIPYLLVNDTIVSPWDIMLQLR